MKLFVFVTSWLFVLRVVGGPVETNVDTDIHRSRDIPVLAFDMVGFPTNAAVAYAQGQADARRDITNGLLCVKSYGLQAPWAPNYRMLLEKRYGVEEENGGCVVSANTVKYAAGYDDVSCAYIEQKFGTNIFDEVAADAKTNWNATHEASVYRVRAGDTLTKIARARGVTMKALIMANEGLDPNKIQIGQKLLIPEKNPEAGATGAPRLK
jgi:LysM repeat protein